MVVVTIHKCGFNFVGQEQEDGSGNYSWAQGNNIMVILHNGHFYATALLLLGQFQKLILRSSFQLFQVTIGYMAAHWALNVCSIRERGFNSSVLVIITNLLELSYIDLV